MRKLEAIILALVLICLGCIGFGGLELGLAMGAMREQIAPAAARLAQTETQLNLALRDVQGIELNTTRTEAEMAGLLNQSRHVAMITAAQEQQLITRTDRLLDDVDTGVVNISAIAPAATHDLEQLEGVIQDSRVLLEASTATVANANTDLSDPHIPDLLSQADTSAKNLTAATGSAAHALGTADIVVTQEAKQLLSVPTKVETVAHVALRCVGWFLGF